MKITLLSSLFKVEVKSVLRIGSAHNNVRTSNVNIAQINSCMKITLLSSLFKVEVKSVLRIGSAHNNVRTSNVNIAQISNVSNFSEHKLYFIFI
jgi:transcriptional regulator GlxA family with amidase domain